MYYNYFCSIKKKIERDFAMFRMKTYFPLRKILFLLLILGILLGSYTPTWALIPSRKVSVDDLIKSNPIVIEHNFWEKPHSRKSTLSGRFDFDKEHLKLPLDEKVLIAYNLPQYGSYPYSGSNSLPKVVLRYPPVSGPRSDYAIPGMMGMGYPRGGYAPTYGGRPFPMYGGGYFGGFPDVTIISNISDMFFTIDDRLVGEFPYSFYYLYPSNSTRSPANRNRN